MTLQASNDSAIKKALISIGLAKRALKFILPYKKKMILTLLVMFVTSSAELVSPYLMKVAIDSGIKGGSIRILTIVAVIYAGAYVLYWVFQYIQARLISQLGQQVVYDIRHKLFSHIQHMSLDFFSKMGTGGLISRTTSDVGTLNDFLTSGALTAVTDTFKMAGIIIIMFRLNTGLTLLTLALVPFVVITTVIFQNKYRNAFLDVRRKIAKITTHVTENVSGVRVVKSFSREKENLRRFERVNRENSQAALRVTVFSLALFAAIEILGSMGTAGIYWYGGIRIQAGALTVGVVVAFINYMTRFYTPLLSMSSFYQTMQAASAGAERIFEILDTEPTIKDKPDAIELSNIQGDVEFKNVTFGYGDSAILKGISFEAKAGETVAIVGPTGAGKTTITNLLTRYYDIESGSILIDGVDIKDVTTTSLRQQIGVVLQDSFLFPTSVKENIRYGRLDATDQEIEAAAKLLGIHEFIKELPCGYKTNVREGGSKLSTGQKQLVAFVRTLLADPKILILDEATSSIDTCTEMVIQKALSKLLQGRTSFVIAHRLSTIAEADRILVLEGGKIIQNGNHKELLAQEGLYRELYNAQFGQLLKSFG